MKPCAYRFLVQFQHSPSITKCCCVVGILLLFTTSGKPQWITVKLGLTSSPYTCRRKKVVLTPDFLQFSCRQSWQIWFCLCLAILMINWDGRLLIPSNQSNCNGKPLRQGCPWSAGDFFSTSSSDVNLFQCLLNDLVGSRKEQNPRLS